MGCEKKCDSYGAFKQHLFWKHKENATTLELYVCRQVNCSFKCRSIKTLKRHLYAHYKKCHNGILCSFRNCPLPNKKFFTPNSLRIHISRMHRCGESNIPDNENINREITLSNMIIENDDNFNSTIFEVEKSGAYSSESFLVKDLATVYLKATSEHCIRSCYAVHDRWLGVWVRKV